MKDLTATLLLASLDSVLLILPWPLGMESVCPSRCHLCLCVMVFMCRGCQPAVHTTPLRIHYMRRTVENWAEIWKLIITQIKISNDVTVLTRLNFCLCSVSKSILSWLEHRLNDVHVLASIPDMCVCVEVNKCCPCIRSPRLDPALM